MINASTVAAPIQKELGSFFSTENHQESDIVRYINSSVRDICIKKNFPFNKFKYDVTIAAGVTDYVIPYQIETYYIVDSAGAQQYILNFEDYYSLIDKSNYIGIWGETLVSEKTGTFTIIYRGFAPTITSLSANISIPEHFYDALVLRGVYYGYMDEKDYPKAAEKDRIFQGMIADLATRNTNTLPNSDLRIGEKHQF